MIRNKTTGLTISRKERLCQTFFSQTLGLMFRPKENLLMLFPRDKVVGVHTFFVFYPLTIVLLDRNWKVLGHRRMAPFQLWTPGMKIRGLLELPNPLRIEVGDVLERLIQE